MGKRIIALAPNITEIIYALGKQDKLVGVTFYSNYPEEAKKLTKIGTYVNFNLEKIVFLNPDLCIATKDGNPKSAINKLQELGIPVYAIDPRNIEGVIRTIKQIGGLLDAEKEAEKIVLDINKKLNKIKEKVNKKKIKKKVFFQVNTDPIYSAGKNSQANELIRLAGGINVCEKYFAYPKLSIEKVIALNPDIIIISSMQGFQDFEKVKKKWEKWKSISAVKNNKIYLIDSDLMDRPSPRIIDALEELEKLIN